MGLSNDIINQFVKITNDDTDTSQGSIAYGVTVQYADRMYVKLDGSDVLTPVETTSTIKSGERVTVLIQDHNATVTGNVTNPSASSTDVIEIGNKIAEFDIVIADKVDTKILNAEIARIEELTVGKADVESLEATIAKIGKLESDTAEIEYLVANKADIEDLDAINANIENLEATVADIDELKADVAEIDLLVNGQLTSDNIQSLILSSGKVTVEDAFIKDAMIDSINAGKITSGEIDTSKVSIGSEDGSMTLTGSLMQVKDDSNIVRIQLGKDASGNFTFCLFSQDGAGVLLDENGIHAGAIPDELIVDDMVASNANINGSKLDIDSVVTTINNGTTTINSSKIFLDSEGQSLSAAFDILKTKVETIEEVTVDGDLTKVMELITSNSTSINMLQGEISTLISNTTITSENGEIIQLKDAYNTTKNTVNGLTTKIGSIETDLDSVTSNQASLALNLNGFKTEVSEVYVTKEELGDMEIGGDYLTKTEFEQSMNNFVFRVEQSGYVNLFANPELEYPPNYEGDWGWDSWYHPENGSNNNMSWGFDAPGEEGNPTDASILWWWSDTWINGYPSYDGFRSSTINVIPNTSYSLSAYMRGEGADYTCVEVFGVDTSGNIIYNHLIQRSTLDIIDSSAATLDHWTRVEGTFTVPSNVYYIYVAWYIEKMFGYEARMHMTRPCLVEGTEVMEWFTGETASSSFTLDKDGITITSGDSDITLNEEGLRFIKGDMLISKIQDGEYSITDKNRGSTMGVLGSGTWEYDGTNYTSLRAITNDNELVLHNVEPGYDLDGLTGNDSLIIIAPKKRRVDDQIYVNAGVNLVNPIISNTMMFKSGGSEAVTDSGGVNTQIIGGLRIYTTGSYSFINTHSRLSLSMFHLGSDYAAFQLVKNASASYKTDINVRANMNMNGYSITNSTSTYSVSPQSTYSRSLIDGGTNEHINHSSMSYDSGEIRWCWKETVFTYPECDIDPETDEWVYSGRNICYVELPLFIAENIQADYHVSIGKIGWGDYRIIEKNQYYFILESQEEDFAFTFEVVAKLNENQTLNANSSIAFNGISLEDTEEENEEEGNV